MLVFVHGNCYASLIFTSDRVNHLTVPHWQKLNLRVRNTLAYLVRKKLNIIVFVHGKPFQPCLNSVSKP